MSSLKWQSFNTSHVTLYQHSGRIWIPWSSVSIHLMLLFIEGTLELELEDDAFQYISCYSLSPSRKRRKNRNSVSIHLMLLFIENSSDEAYNVMLFQYISCYSLSMTNLNMKRLLISFNTSHVTLYPSWNYVREENEVSFNTSHVTLYQQR